MSQIGLQILHSSIYFKVGLQMHTALLFSVVVTNKIKKRFKLLKCISSVIYLWLQTIFYGGRGGKVALLIIKVQIPGLGLWQLSNHMCNVATFSLIFTSSSKFRLLSE